MTWEPLGDRLHCARHGETFDRLDQCRACEGDPGPAPGDESIDEPVEFPPGIPTPDEVLLDLDLDLSDLRDLKRAIWSKAEVMDSHIANSYIKAQDAATKIARILLDAGYLRRDAVLVDRREKRLVKGARGAGH